MPFFDIKKSSNKDINLAQKKKKTKSKYLLDPLNPEVKSKMSLTDIFGKNAKRATSYIVVGVKKNFRDLKSALLKFAGLAILIVIVFNLISAYGVFLNKYSQLRSDAHGFVDSLHEVFGAVRGGDLAQASLSLGDSRRYLDEILVQTKKMTTVQDGIAGDGNLFDQIRFLNTAAESFMEASELGVQSLARMLPLRSEVLVPEGQVSVSEALADEYLVWQEIYQKLQVGSENLALVNESFFPEDVREMVVDTNGLLVEMLPYVGQMLDYFPTVLEMLGNDYPKRYLVLFQNSDEIRPTGGFIGNIALVEWNDGRLTKLEIRDVYQFDGQIQNPEVPPEYFGAITDNWGMRDSNYSPDFPTSAKKAAEFFEKGGGVTVDGVIAVDQSLLEDLLEITGEIELSGFPVPLNSENFTSLVGFNVENKTFGVENPKKPLADFYPIFQKRLLEEAPKHLPELIKIWGQAVSGGSLQAYSFDENTNDFFAYLGIGGELYQGGEDYLGIVHTNVGGNKSDKFTSDAVKHNTIVHADGTIEDELVLRRTHGFQNVWEIVWENIASGQWNENVFELALAHEGDGFAENVNGRIPLADNDMYEIMGRGANRDYVRVYVPLGSEIITSQGTGDVKTYEDLGKTVFAFSLETLPKTTSQVALRYSVPREQFLEKYNDYNLYVEHQAGTDITDFTKEITLPEGLEVLACFPDCERMQREISTDVIFGYVFGN